VNSTLIIVIAVVVLLLIGFLVAVGASRRQKTKRLKGQFGTEYAATMTASGSKKKGQKELDERQKHVKTLNIRPLTVSERDRYQTDWTAVQTRFVDEPGQAIESADHLIMEVMQLRGYPVSDFDQRAADISVKYPKLVSNYRAARAIAVKNEHHEADTEELRQAMIHYRSLFKELLVTETAK
jgi:hypothetical protein